MFKYNFSWAIFAVQHLLPLKTLLKRMGVKTKTLFIKRRLNDVILENLLTIIH